MGYAQFEYWSEIWQQTLELEEILTTTKLFYIWTIRNWNDKQLTITDNVEVLDGRGAILGIACAEFSR